MNIFWWRKAECPPKEATEAVKEAEQANRNGRFKDREANRVKKAMQEHTSRNGWTKLFEELYRG